jgi:uncharacterized membrane protein YdjX (TVP38/TMEM64 family)
MHRRIIGIIPFAIILIFIFIFYLSGLYHQLNFDTIKSEYGSWKMFVSNHPWLSAFYFVGIYAISVVLVIPDSTILTLLGGSLFPLPLAIIYSCIAETVGATIFFLAARLAFVETLDTKKGYRMRDLQMKFQANQAYYLLFLRFSHLLPFWLINLSAGIFRVRTSTFIWTTFIGVIPLTFFIAESGASLAKYFETHTSFTFKGVFTLETKIALVVLGCIALLPIAYKKFIKNRKNKENSHRH